MDKVQVTLPNQNPKKIPEALFIVGKFYFSFDIIK